VLVGDGAPWQQTLSAFVDDLDTPDVATVFGRPASAPPHALFSRVVDGFTVWGHRRHRVERAYGVLDNDYVRRELHRNVSMITGRAVSASRTAGSPAVVRLADGTEIETVVVVDAAGGSAWSGVTGSPVARQVAFGVVVPDLPPGFDGTTFMDFRPVGTDDPTTFCYTVPVSGGWLVEETVLATRDAVDVELLRRKLAARLGPAIDGDVHAGADHGGVTRTESVDITLARAGPDRARRDEIATYGAAAGYVHPATGYSVSTSLRSAHRVARSVVGVVRHSADPATVDAAVWTRPMRVTRHLHRYGLDVLLRLDANDVRTFFDLFFDLPVATWSPYLRVDADPRDVATAMRKLFVAAPSGLRRQLVTSMPSWGLVTAGGSLRSSLRSRRTRS
jgi:lycopene beta-cyclase